ncbi:MAG: hypothetical protein K0R50_105 [Eubacterium sp.]|jgi:hypothetical protein|nr:hypothetical protein [Eubacterium sp.]
MKSRDNLSKWSKNGYFAVDLLPVRKYNIICAQDETLLKHTE